MLSSSGLGLRQRACFVSKICKMCPFIQADTNLLPQLSELILSRYTLLRRFGDEYAFRAGEMLK